MAESEPRATDAQRGEAARRAAAACDASGGSREGERGQGRPKASLGTPQAGRVLYSPAAKGLRSGPLKAYVVIAGNIGAGKSTLVRMICERLHWDPYFEPVAENPYLADFYKDMTRWAFNSQVFFLTHRARSHRALMDSRRPVVQDRSFYEDAEVFAKAQFVLGHMSQRDWQTYLGLYQTLTTLLSPPDLVVYLRASVPTLRRRITQRGRSIESDIADDYLERLNGLYEDWMSRFDQAPVLVVPSDRLDFVEDSRDLAAIVSTVQRQLRGRQGLLFPEEVQGR
jgi:deoxyadenosine/deoxycytidine kinase